LKFIHSVPEEIGDFFLIIQFIPREQADTEISENRMIREKAHFFSVIRSSSLKKL